MEEIIRDRRAYVRLNVTLDVDYKPKQEQATFQRSLGKDIALGGLRLFTQDELSPGTRLDLVIKVPGYNETCLGAGEVVWNEKAKDQTGYYVTGIKFTEIDLVKLSMLIINSSVKGFREE